jgi:hypothetical protein
VLEGRFVAVGVSVAVAVGVNVLVAVGRTGWNGVAVAGFSNSISRLTSEGVEDEMKGREKACA